MTDCFALLNEPRRPWLETEGLKQKFSALASELHPDRVHNAGEGERRAAQERYTELNAACQCLIEPKARLRHLLELERGSRPQPVQSVPADLMQFFMEVNRLCRQADKVLAENAGITSPLLKVQAFEYAQECIDTLAVLRAEIDAHNECLTGELKNLDAQWDGPVDSPARTTRLQRCEELCRRFSFFVRWRQQVQERITQLSF